MGAKQQLRKQLPVLRRWLEADEQPWLYSAKIKLLTSCNLDCSFCQWRVTAKTPRHTLTLSNLQPVLAELKSLGVTRVHFTGGEPLIHPELLEILTYSRELGIPELGMTTNATLITTASAANLFAAGLRHVNVSLDGEAEDFHGKFARATEGLANLLEARRTFDKADRPAIRVNIVIGSNNLTQIPDFVKNLKRLGVDGLNLLPIKREKHLFLNPSQIAWFRDNAAPVIRECFGEKVLSRDPYGDSGALDGEYTRDYYQANRCYIPYVHTFFSADGGVHICCERQTTERPLGNILKSSLYEILTNDYYRAERQRQDAPGCRVCGMFQNLNNAIDELMVEAPVGA